MADLPLDKRAKLPSAAPKDQQVKVTAENVHVLTIHFLNQIHSRLGYIVKLLEEKK